MGGVVVDRGCVGRGGRASGLAGREEESGEGSRNEESRFHGIMWSELEHPGRRTEVPSVRCYLSLARYLSGLALNFLMHGLQQNFTSCPLWTMVTGSPIEPSLLPDTMQVSLV